MTIEIMLLVLLGCVALNAFIAAINSSGTTKIVLSYTLATIILIGAVIVLLQHINAADNRAQQAREAELKVRLVEEQMLREKEARMTEEQILAVESSGKLLPRLTVVAPIGGVVTELGAREGMTVMAGAPLFRINGLGTVWVNAEVRESQASEARSQSWTRRPARHSTASPAERPRTLMTREGGKPLSVSNAEVLRAADAIEYYAALGEIFPEPARLAPAEIGQLVVVVGPEGRLPVPHQDQFSHRP